MPLFTSVNNPSFYYRNPEWDLYLAAHFHGANHPRKFVSTRKTAYFEHSCSKSSRFSSSMRICFQRVKNKPWILSSVRGKLAQSTVIYRSRPHRPLNVLLPNFRNRIPGAFTWQSAQIGIFSLEFYATKLRFVPIMKLSSFRQTS